MDLTKIEPIDFRTRLDAHESLAIVVSKRRNNRLVRMAIGGTAGVGTVTGGMWLVMTLMASLINWPLWLVMPILMLGTVVSVLGAAAVASPFLEPPERKLLAAIAGPDALDFLDDHWLRRERLLAEADAFNEALAAFKALPARAGQDEIDEGVCANLAERRARIEAEIGTYLAAFSKATEEERARVAAANVRQKRLPSPHRRSLRDYRKKVKLLKRLERSLDGLLDSAGPDTTIDLSPYQAVLRFRAELEEERATLLRCGFKPRKLPKPPGDRKLLGP